MSSYNNSVYVANFAAAFFAFRLKLFARDYLQHGNTLQRHIFTITNGNFDEEFPIDIAAVHNKDETSSNNNFENSLTTQYLHSNSCPNDINLYFENPAFESDFECGNSVEVINGPHSGSRSPKPTIPKIDNFVRYRSGLPNNSNVLFQDETSNAQNENQEKVIGCRRYETWPSPKARRRSLTRTLNQPRSFSEADNCPYCRQNRQNAPSTETDSKKQISVNCNSHKCKDNRYKSSLRRHAMAGPPLSNSLDDHAVESLSKEDLLVLWKRSEIELQTKLNRIISQNNHLRQMINIVEAAECELRETAEETTEDFIKVTKL